MISAEEARAAAQERQERDAIKLEVEFEAAQDEVMSLIDSRSAAGDYNGFYYPPTEEIKVKIMDWLEPYGFRITIIPKPENETKYVCILKISWNS